MKKVLLSAVAAAFLLASCGTDVCDCVNGMKDLEKKYEEARESGDEDKMKEIEKEGEALEEKCDKLTDGMSDDEKKEFRKKAKECK